MRRELLRFGEGEADGDEGLGAAVGGGDAGGFDAGVVEELGEAAGGGVEGARGVDGGVGAVGEGEVLEEAGGDGGELSLSMFGELVTVRIPKLPRTRTSSRAHADRKQLGEKACSPAVAFAGRK